MKQGRAPPPPIPLHPYHPFGWSASQTDHLSSALTGQPPQTDCQELPLSDSRPESGARREAAERRRRAGSLTADQTRRGGQSVRLDGGWVGGGGDGARGSHRKHAPTQKLGNLLLVFRKPITRPCKGSHLRGVGGFHHHCGPSPAPRASQHIRPPP